MTNYHLLLTRSPTPADRSQPQSTIDDRRERRQRTLLYSTAVLIAVAILVYANVRAFVWDEGFHLIAAQLIAAGKRPYLDFCFPQTPFNAYWNAALLLVFGHGWRVTHTFAAFLTIGTFCLVAEYLLSRFPSQRWRTATAAAGLIFVALNTTAVEFGCIAQAYAMCLFTGFAAFRVTVAAVNRTSPALSAVAGVFAGAAAASSLLSAPVALVLCLWILLRNRNGSRWFKLWAFLLGAAISFAPVIWLFILGPRQTFFNVVQYQAIFRRVNWGDANTHDIDILSSWVDSGQALITGLLALAGFAFLRRSSNWETVLRRELYLCGLITLSLIAYISTAHPTFSRYFVVAIPFMAVLAAIGLYHVGSTLVSAEKPFWSVAAVLVIFAVGIGHALYVDRESVSWKRYEDLTKKVLEVTPKGAPVFADEHVYFLMNIAPPPGLEFSYSHKLQLSPKEEAEFHILSADELKQQVQKGQYVTLETCSDDLVDDWQLGRAFNHQAEIGDCYVYWDVNREAHFERDKKTPKPSQEYLKSGEREPSAISGQQPNDRVQAWKSAS